MSFDVYIDTRYIYGRIRIQGRVERYAHVHISICAQPFKLQVETHVHMDIPIVDWPALSHACGQVAPGSIDMRLYVSHMCMHGFVLQLEMRLVQSCRHAASSPRQLSAHTGPRPRVSSPCCPCLCLGQASMLVGIAAHGPHVASSARPAVIDSMAGSVVHTHALGAVAQLVALAARARGAVEVGARRAVC